MKKVLLVMLAISCSIFAQGNAIFKVTDYPDEELCPRVSPDGERLAYVDLKVVGPFPVANIRVATVDGKNSMLATTGQGPQIDNQYPSWFPNSAQLAYERLVPVANNIQTYEIWAVPFNSSNGTKLVQNNYNFSVMPDISAIGDAVFVTSGNLDCPFPGYPVWRFSDVPPPADVMGNFIIAIQPAGQSVILNTIPGLYPRWNPDGKLVAYSAWNATTGWDIFIADYEKVRGLTNFRQITSEPGDEFAPAWSPDGDWIAYSYARPATPSPINIFVINIHNGTKIQETLEPNSVITMPDWVITEDGEEYIYCCSNMDGDFDIYRFIPSTAEVEGVSASAPAPGATLRVKTPKSEQEKKREAEIRVIVLNTSTDKQSDIAQGFASKVGEQLMQWNENIVVTSVINGSDSGEPHIYYSSDKYEKLANDIALYLDGLITGGVLYSETQYLFFPAEPLSSSPYKLSNVDILVEAPAN
ncbi:hypothetical protein DRQ33_06310 [bacterium]|nr:MAG: hypothetical protein DRQ33_06310 [bacterium]